MFDLGQLCVLKGSQCWILYIDILILECGGNLFDAVSMGVKAAMHSTRIPNVKVRVDVIRFQGKLNLITLYFLLPLIR